MKTTQVLSLVAERRSPEQLSHVLPSLCTTARESVGHKERIVGCTKHSFIFFPETQNASLESHFSSVPFSHSVMSDSLQPHESQHARPPCPPTTPGVYSNSCPSSQCHPAISSSVIPFSSCPHSLPASGSFPLFATLRMRWPKYWSFSFNISPSSEYPGLISFRMDGLDLLAVPGTLKSLLQYHSSKSISSSVLNFLHS